MDTSLLLIIGVVVMLSICGAGGYFAYTKWFAPPPTTTSSGTSLPWETSALSTTKMPGNKSSLSEGESLAPNEKMVVNDSHLVLQNDGNLVAYITSTMKPTWTSETMNTPATTVKWMNGSIIISSATAEIKRITTLQQCPPGSILTLVQGVPAAKSSDGGIYGFPTEYLR
jgi:hypothetical protein